MNPFNPEPLTDDQLKQDCLAYMSIQQQPVKSSRLFMGRIHDVNVKHLTEAFDVEESAYKKVVLNEKLLRELNQKNQGAPVFFKEGLPSDYLDNSVDIGIFDGFTEAYNQLMIDLVELTVKSIELIIAKEDSTTDMFITGGFSKNPIFVKLMASRFPGKRIYTSEIANATSLGAALVLWKSIERKFDPHIELELKHCEGDTSLVK
jgi:hypothetical protein